MTNDAIIYTENSFLKDYLFLDGVTDISYNGSALFYTTNYLGRRKAKTSPSEKEVGDFLRQIANLVERQFSYTSPVLDVSFGRYRLNALFMSIVRKANKKTYSFAIRIASEEIKIHEEDPFFGGDSAMILKSLIEKGESIIIGGKTSSGKTELEKWLISIMKENTRVIVIDNVEELDLIDDPKLDLTTWIVNEGVNGGSFSGLIKNALRNNPDYIVVAEARGEEMLDALISAMSGHPILTTIHAQDILSMPDRMVRLAMMANKRNEKKDLFDDIAHHMRYYVYLEKKEEEDGTMNRYIDSIGVLDENTHQMNFLYKRG
ncbi:MAG: CpaF/VirB11 family protein [Bacilli bacterium]|nr:CpaF/VirB11 family protein [Bacilli bacterium]